MGDFRKYPYTMPGVASWSSKGEGGFLDWNPEGRGWNAVWNSKHMGGGGVGGGFSYEFPEGEDGKSFAWNSWSENFSSL